MKLKILAGVLTVLLLFSGCRFLGDRQAGSGTAQPTASASTPALATYEDGVTSGIDKPDSSAAPLSNPPPSDALQSAAPTDASVPAASGEVIPSAAASDEPATEEETSAALDDILQQLNDLDQLYSQLDDVQDSDLSD